MARARAVKPVTSMKLVRGGVGPDSQLTVKFIRAGAKDRLFTNISEGAFQALSLVIVHMVGHHLLRKDWPVDLGMARFYLRVTLNTSVEYSKGLVGLDNGERRSWGEQT